MGDQWLTNRRLGVMGALKTKVSAAASSRLHHPRVVVGLLVIDHRRMRGPTKELYLPRLEFP